MTHARERIAAALKQARQQRGLSQRELSVRAGVPQSHISKIENSEVDLRLSSLDAITRALSLEFVLVPHRAMPAVKSVAQAAVQPVVDPAISKELRKIEAALIPFDEHAALRSFQNSLKNLSQFRHLLKTVAPLRELRATLQGGAPDSIEALRQAADQLRVIQATLASGQKVPGDPERPRPAYRLEEGDDD